MDLSHDEIIDKINVLETENESLKVTKEILNYSENKYRNLVKYAVVGIYEVDFTTMRLVTVNDIICTYTGYSEYELLSKSYIDFTDDEGKKLLLSRIERGKNGERLHSHVELKIFKKDGTSFWAQVIVVHLRDDKGNLTGASGIVYDMSETIRRRKLEESRKSLTDSVWDIFNLTTDWYVLVLDNKHRVKLCNNNLALALGYDSYSDLIDVEWCVHTPEDIREVLHRFYESSLLGEVEAEREFITDIITKDEKRITVRWFNTKVNGWMLRIGIPLISELTLNDSVEKVRAYFKNQILKDRSLIRTFKEMVKNDNKR